MTGKQKEARRLSAQGGHIRWIKDNCLRTGETADETGEDYVFISYKSDDYEQALDNILYRTCRKYGLRVYFDVAFDDGSDSWINQFYENMCNPHCKAMIAFISNKYYSSYATLMEMMARMTPAAGGDWNFDTLFFLPINLEPITEIGSSNANTGLGTSRFADGDGRLNPHADLELEKFNFLFEQVVDRKKEVKPLFPRFGEREPLYQEAVKTKNLPKVGKPFLVVSQCRKLMSMVCPKSNDNDGSNKAFEDAIHDKLATAGLESVFIPDWTPLPSEPDAAAGPSTPPEPAVITAPPKPPEPDTRQQPELIPLPDFLARYNNSSFKKDTFQKVRLVGAGEYAGLSTEFFDSVYPVVWSFVMKLLKERGEDYIHFVNGKNSKMKHPPFITTQEHQERKKQNSSITYRNLELPGLSGYSMCRHYGQYGWVSDVLCKRIQELEMPLEAFSLECVPHSAEPAVMPEPKAPDTGRIEGPVDLKGRTGKQKKAALEKDGYSFTLRGERYSGLKLKAMMLTVFQTTLPLHPDKLDLILDKLPCVGEGIKISPDAKPTTFRAGDDTLRISGRSISVGTSLNQGQVLKYIGRLMQLCGEPKENLVIDGYDY